jgi:hypothetical protein
MRSRRLRWVLTGLAVMIAVGAVALWPREDRITREKFHRIEIGMSRAEVEAILGGPPGDYRTVWTDWATNVNEEPFTCGSVDGHVSNTGAGGYDPDGLLGEAVSSGVPLIGNWFGNDGCIQIHFSPKFVDDKDFLPTVRRERGLLDNLSWRTRRLWRRGFDS